MNDMDFFEKLKYYFEYQKSQKNLEYSKLHEDIKNFFLYLKKLK